MKYYGKRYLYNFLKERYDLNKILADYGRKITIKDFSYAKFRGFEWLRFPFKEIEVTSPYYGCDVVYVTINKIDDESGKKTRVEYSKYVDGVLDFQEKNGRVLKYHRERREVSRIAEGI